MLDQRSRRRKLAIDDAVIIALVAANTVPRRLKYPPVAPIFARIKLAVRLVVVVRLAPADDVVNRPRRFGIRLELTADAGTA